MRRIVQVLAVAAALAAFPAGAGESEPIPGSERDPFSQTYAGRDPEEVRAERERERKEARSCTCGHDRAPKKERPER